VTDPHGIWALMNHFARQYEEQASAERARAAGIPQPLKAGVPFKDQAAMAEAMSDPRYKTDPEYRKWVAARALGGLNARARYGR
jgi:hypothetical protein